MPERSVTHHTFRIERLYDSSPAQVFAAYADPAARRRWFVEGEGWDVESCHLDFRQGATESSTFRFRGGPLIRNDTTYHDIVENERFVFAYTMVVGDNRISASLGTVELIPEGNGTRHVYTEQGAYLDGFDNVAGREEGSRQLFEALARELQQRRKAA
jgi:uncharacterized protein YndB with AHSA1/START domain